jgi:hypothetical protein
MWVWWFEINQNNIFRESWISNVFWFRFWWYIDDMNNLCYVLGCMCVERKIRFRVSYGRIIRKIDNCCGIL